MRLLPWSDDRIARLTKLWAEGYSCSQIAAMMGEQTRNGVIGKLYRLGLKRDDRVVRKDAPRAAREHKRDGRARVPANPNTRRIFLTREPLELKALRCAEIVPLLVGLLDLQEHHCRWPYDAETPTAYCGHGKVEGHSYCGPHANLSRGQGTPSERAATSVPSLVPA